MANTELVFVIDDDESVRTAVANLLEAVSLRAQVFASTEEFFKTARPNIPCCLVLDVQLPGTSGLQFQESLARAGIMIPIIFITAHGDIPMALRAVRRGAVEFLTKPFQKEELLTAIHRGLDADRTWLQEHAGDSALQARFEELTAREREVMEMVASGLANKQIAAELQLSEVTVKIHRSRVMQKMQANSIADLVRMSDRLKRTLGR